MLLLAVILIVLIGVAHSLLGERYILTRLFRRPLPELFGSDEFTKKTLRFAWHITTVAWFGFGAILLQIYGGQLSRDNVLGAIGVVFAVSDVKSVNSGISQNLSNY